jgi:hypothetical protein
MAETTEDTYSYHTFLFPFVWNDDGTVTYEEFIEVLAVGVHWFSLDWPGKKLPGKGVSSDPQYKSDWFLNYKIYQYFNAPARNLLFNTSGETDWVVHSFEFRPNGIPLRNTGKFFIEKRSKPDENGRDTTRYALTVNSIKLMLYNTGSAVMIFEYEYKGNRERYNSARTQDESFKEISKTLADVNTINEMGRRVNFPYFIQSEEDYPDVVADKLWLDVGDETINAGLIEDFRAFHDELSRDFDKVSKSSSFSLSYIFQPIRTLLSYDNKSSKKVTSTRGKNYRTGKELFVYPLIDDRMFVCCLVRDTEFLNLFSEWNEEEKEYNFIVDCSSTDFGVSSELYKYTYIEEEPTCIGHDMRRELLKNSIYTRWLMPNEGTLYGITHHSFVCATTHSAPDHLVETFLSLYIDLAIIALVQRATILSISAQASELAKSFKKNETRLDAKQLQEISELHEEYVRAENQILLVEVTPQEQGIELFQLLSKQLYIEQNKGELDKQLNNLYEVSNINNDRIDRESDNILNGILLVLAICAISISVWQVVQYYYEDSVCVPLLWSVSVTILLIVAYIIASRFVKRRRRRRR